MSFNVGSLVNQLRSSAANYGAGGGGGASTGEGAGSLGMLGSLLQLAGTQPGMNQLSMIGKAIIDSLGASAGRGGLTPQAGGQVDLAAFNTAMRDVLGALDQKGGAVVAAAERNGKGDQARAGLDALKQLLYTLVALANLLLAGQSQGTQQPGASQGGQGGKGGNMAANAVGSMLQGLMDALFGSEEDEEEDDTMGALLGAMQAGMQRAQAALGGGAKGGKGSEGGSKGTGGTKGADGSTKGSETNGKPGAAGDVSKGSTKGSEFSDKSAVDITSAADLDKNFKKNEKGEYVIDRTCSIKGNVDLQGARVTGASNMGDGGQSEGQKPLFAIQNGGSLSNANIGDNGADGIHTFGNASLNNVNYENVGEDAITVKKSGDVSVTNCTFSGASDKVIQVNADCNLKVDACKANGFQTFIRTNGGKQITANIDMTNCELDNGRRAVYTDSKNVVANLSDNILRNVRTAFQDAGNAILNSLRNALGSATERGRG